MSTAAVVGCGDVSSVHFEAISALDGIELIAVCDTDEANLAAAVEARGVPGYATVAAMLAEVKPDVVHITTPHHQHVDAAIACLEAGVNVILEKPVAHTTADAERLIVASEASSAKLGICLQNRYNAPVQAAREIIDSGELGKILGATSTVMWTRIPSYYTARPWRGRWDQAGGGLLINQAIHTLDLIQWLVGDVTKATGHVCSRFYSEVSDVEDTAEIALEHEGGARTIFFGTLGSVVNHPVSIDITLERGSLSLRGDLTITREDGSTQVVEERKVPTSGRTYWGFSHQILIEDFYNQLDDPEPFWITAREGSKSLRILKDVYAQSYPASVPTDG